MRLLFLPAVALLVTACGDREAPRDTQSQPAQAAVAAPAPTVPARIDTPVPSTLPPVAVIVGGDEEFDACGSAGMIKPSYGADVEVRTGPGARYPALGRVTAEKVYFECDSREGWVGIVYNAKGDDLECGVGTPIPTRGPYDGSCASGWIPAEADSLVAG